jgi:hypothetical protein
MSTERKWACGCHEVEGQLVAECTQQRPSGEISSSQNAMAKPFSTKCFRLAPAVEETRAAEPAAEPTEIGAATPAACDAEQTQPAPVAPEVDEPIASE